MNPLRPFLTASVPAIPAAISVEQVISGGNLALATVAAIFAVLAGRWAWRKQRLDAETAELNKQIAEMALIKALDESRTRAPFSEDPPKPAA